MNPILNNPYSQSFSQVNTNFQNTFPTNNVNSQYSFNNQMTIPVNNPNIQVIPFQVTSAYSNPMMNNLSSQNYNIGNSLPGNGLQVLPSMPIYQSFSSGPLNCYPVINQPPHEPQMHHAQSNISKTENLTNQINSSIQEISYYQIYRNTLENCFKNMPENFSYSLFEKLNPKFEEGLRKFKNCSEEIKLTEESLQNKVKSIKEKVTKLENSILSLENKTNNLDENHQEYQNLLTNFFSLNQDIKTEKIMKERQHEEKINKLINEVEMMKFQVQENIFKIEQDISQNINLEEETWKEIRKMILERLNDVNNEIKKVELEKINSANIIDDNRFSQQNSKLKINKKIDFKNSVKKLNDVKMLIEKIKNKTSIFIEKENFSFLGRNKFSKNLKASFNNDYSNKSYGTEYERIIDKLNQPNNNRLNMSKKIRKSVDFSFFK